MAIIPSRQSYYNELGLENPTGTEPLDSLEARLNNVVDSPQYRLTTLFRDLPGDGFQDVASLFQRMCSAVQQRSFPVDTPININIAYWSPSDITACVVIILSRIIDVRRSILATTVPQSATQTSEQVQTSRLLIERHAAVFNPAVVAAAVSLGNIRINWVRVFDGLADSDMNWVQLQGESWYFLLGLWQRALVYSNWVTSELAAAGHPVPLPLSLGDLDPSRFNMFPITSLAPGLENTCLTSLVDFMKHHDASFGSNLITETLLNSLPSRVLLEVAQNLFYNNPVLPGLDLKSFLDKRLHAPDNNQFVFELTTFLQGRLASVAALFLAVSQGSLRKLDMHCLFLDARTGVAIISCFYDFAAEAARTYDPKDPSTCTAPWLFEDRRLLQVFNKLRTMVIQFYRDEAADARLSEKSFSDLVVDIKYPNGDASSTRISSVGGMPAASDGKSVPALPPYQPPPPPPPRVEGVNQFDLSASDATNFPPQTDPAIASMTLDQQVDVYFGCFYRGELSTVQLINLMTRLASNPVGTAEHDLLAAMLNTLFSESRHLHKYPEQELRATAGLFSMLMMSPLVRMKPELSFFIEQLILDGLKKADTDPKMCKFAIAVIVDALDSLPQSPQFVSELARNPALEAHVPHVARYCQNVLECYPPNIREMTRVDDSVMSSLEKSLPTDSGNIHIPSELQLGGRLLSSQPLSRGSVDPSAPSWDPEGSNVVFGSVMTPDKTAMDNATRDVDGLRKQTSGVSLGQVEVLLEDQQILKQVTIPPQWFQNKVSRTFNSLVPMNLEQKGIELQTDMQKSWYPWLAFYVVKARVSKEINHATVYAEFAEHVGHPRFLDLLINVTYDCINVLLKYATVAFESKSYRTVIKNLATWLGILTLGSNKPLKSKNLDIKKLVFDGFVNGRLTVVVPLVCRILYAAPESKAFKLPNPWTTAILNTLVELSCVPNLKQNIHFEIQLLFKTFKLDLTAYQSQFNTATNPFLALVPVAGSPDVSQGAEPLLLEAKMAGQQHDMHEIDKTWKPSGQIEPGASPPVSVPRPVSQPNAALIRMLSNSVVVPNAVTMFQMQREVCVAVPIAIERAIRDVLWPVVEKAVTVAVATTREIVLTDFVLEPDVCLVKRAANLMAASLAGSLVTVTGKSPLKIAIHHNLRGILKGPMTSFSEVTYGLLQEAFGTQTANQILADSGTSLVPPPNPKTPVRPNLVSLLSQLCQVITTENLNLGCGLVEQVVVEKCVKVVQTSFANDIQYREQWAAANSAQGRPVGFADPTMIGAYERVKPTLPSPLQKPDPLTDSHLEVYKEFLAVEPLKKMQTSGARNSPALKSRALGNVLNSLGNDQELPAAIQQQQQQQQQLQQLQQLQQQAIFDGKEHASGFAAPAKATDMPPAREEPTRQETVPTPPAASAPPPPPTTTSTANAHDLPCEVLALAGAVARPLGQPGDEQLVLNLLTALKDAVKDIISNPPPIPGVGLLPGATIEYCKPIGIDSSASGAVPTCATSALTRLACVPSDHIVFMAVNTIPHIFNMASNRDEFSLLGTAKIFKSTLDAADLVEFMPPLFCGVDISGIYLEVFYCTFNLLQRKKCVENLSALLTRWYSICLTRDSSQLSLPDLKNAPADLPPVDFKVLTARSLRNQLSIISCAIRYECVSANQYLEQTVEPMLRWALATAEPSAQEADQNTKRQSKPAVAGSAPSEPATPSPTSRRRACLEFVSQFVYALVVEWRCISVPQVSALYSRGSYGSDFDGMSILDMLVWLCENTLRTLPRAKDGSPPINFGPDNERNLTIVNALELQTPFVLLGHLTEHITDEANLRSIKEKNPSFNPSNIWADLADPKRLTLNVKGPKVVPTVAEGLMYLYSRLRLVANLSGHDQVPNIMNTQPEEEPILPPLPEVYRIDQLHNRIHPALAKYTCSLSKPPTTEPEHADLIALVFDEWRKLLFATMPSSGGDADKPTQQWAIFFSKVSRHGLVKMDENTDRFFSLSIERALYWARQEIAEAADSAAQRGHKFDPQHSIKFLVPRNSLWAFGKMVATVVRLAVPTRVPPAAVCQRCLHAIMRVLQQDAATTKFNADLYFTLIVSVASEVLLLWQKDSLEMFALQSVLCFASAFQYLSPRYVPAFSTHYASLLSHQAFVRNIMKKVRGWMPYKVLLEDLLSALCSLDAEEHISDTTPHIYGTANLQQLQSLPHRHQTAVVLNNKTFRILSFVANDFPEFVASAASSLLQKIGHNFPFLRNVLLCATPRHIGLLEPGKVICSEIWTVPYSAWKFPTLSYNNWSLLYRDLIEKLSSYCSASVENISLLKEIQSCLSLSPDSDSSDAQSAVLANKSRVLKTRHNEPAFAAMTEFCIFTSPSSTAIPDAVEKSTYPPGWQIFGFLLVQLDEEGQEMILNSIIDGLRYPCPQTFVAIDLLTHCMSNDFLSNLFKWHKNMVPANLDLRMLEPMIRRLLELRVNGFEHCPWGVQVMASHSP